MFTGLTVALVTGVPLGTFIGQHYGWRATFLAVSGLGLVAFVGSALFVPRTITHTASASLKEQASVLLQPRLLLVYAMTLRGLQARLSRSPLRAVAARGVGLRGGCGGAGHAGVRRVRHRGQHMGRQVGRLAWCARVEDHFCVAGLGAAGVAILLRRTSG